MFPAPALRCTPCKGDGKNCPPNATCGDKPGADGVLRCLPGR